MAESTKKEEPFTIISRTTVRELVKRGYEPYKVEPYGNPRD
ncbi:hypothetical protein COLO4_05208 [Corchorus olitorius]|uniref:Uncharacterized protein n=1 Tax=Corchorus olitorius TaxID=93759 RepID=A0A1R3KRM0_9ROSI|nr:hypothetical protein COLO4_05208 [Corchorus olitorius]